MRDAYKRVYQLLRRIPRGKATTYGAIGRRLDLNPRFVGRILSKNEHPRDYPCYKVVKSDGSLGGYTMKGGSTATSIKIKKKKLLADGVTFRNGRVARSSLVRTADLS